MRRAQLSPVALVGVVMPPLASLQATDSPLDLGEVPLELLVGSVEGALQLIGQVVVTIGAKLGD